MKRNNNIARIKDHAEKRIRQRCSLSSQDVAKKLMTNDYFPLGMDGKHHHKIIYSELDSEMFVVVQDKKNMDVITVMPLYWHNRWELSPETIMLAKKHFGIFEDEFGEFLPEENNKLEKDFKKEKKHNVIVVVNIKEVKMHKLKNDCWKKLPKSKSVAKNLCKLSQDDFVNLGFKIVNFNPENLKDSVEKHSDKESINNLKSYIRSTLEQIIFEQRRRYVDLENYYVDTSISFCINFGSFSFKSNSLGTIRYLIEPIKKGEKHEKNN